MAYVPKDLVLRPNGEITVSNDRFNELHGNF